MKDVGIEGLKQPKTLRLWPGVVIVAIQWIVRFVVPIIEPDALQLSVMGGVLGGLLLIFWWLFFSRAYWMDRLGAVILMIGAIALTSVIVDETIATSMMGMMLIVYAVPVLSLAFVFWALISRSWSNGLRRATMVATIALASGVWTLFRTGGFSSEMRHDFDWRWAETREAKLLANPDNDPIALPKASSQKVTDIAWPGFRGGKRDGVVRGVQIETDWSVHPPVELWRREVGPGWSSFAARGDVFYTQEQRGEAEVVACYLLSSGEPVWRHGDNARFWESNAGAGPRATPTLSEDRLFTLGATGILNAFDAHTGNVVWTRNAATDTGIGIPRMGICGVSSGD